MKHKTYTKRLLSMLLVALLIASVLPISTSATSAETYAPIKTNKAALEEAPNPPAAEDVTYTLTYDPNGGVGGPEMQTDVNSTGSALFTIPAEVPTKEGSEFWGWAETTTATQPKYAPGTRVAVYEANPNMTLYAVWKNTTEPKPTEKTSEPGMKKTADVKSLGRGQEVNFTLLSNVPDYLGDYLRLPVVPDPEIVTTNAADERGSYILNIHDVMDAGLTYKESTLSVTVNDVVLTETQYDKTITKNDDGTTSFLISMDLVKLCEQKVFTEQDIEKTPEIKVTYTATLDETAVAGKYNNEAWTSYPAPIQADASKGEKESIHSTVTLDVYGIRVFKYDQNGNTPLEGAEFRLLAADGSTVLEENIPSGADGYLMFDGLAAGTYYVEETKAPEGYVKSDKALEVVLPEKANQETNVADSQFANARIPHTGGSGTTAYIVLGGAMIGMAAALYLASRKRRHFQA